MITKSILSVGLALLISGCAGSTHRLNEQEILKKSIDCFSKGSVILTTVSRGGIGDAMAISSAKSLGTDGGFFDSIEQSIEKGTRNFSVYSSNSEKISVYLINALSKFQDNELSGVGFCYIGDIEYKDGVLKEVNRVGAIFKYQKPTDK